MHFNKLPQEVVLSPSLWISLWAAREKRKPVLREDSVAWGGQAPGRWPPACRQGQAAGNWVTLTQINWSRDWVLPSLDPGSHGSWGRVFRGPQGTMTNNNIATHTVSLPGLTCVISFNPRDNPEVDPLITPFYRWEN